MSGHLIIETKTMMMNVLDLIMSSSDYSGCVYTMYTFSILKNTLSHSSLSVKSPLRLNSNIRSGQSLNYVVVGETLYHSERQAILSSTHLVRVGLSILVHSFKLSAQHFVSRPRFLRPLVFPPAPFWPDFCGE